MVGFLSFEAKGFETSKGSNVLLIVDHQLARGGIQESMRRRQSVNPLQKKRGGDSENKTTTNTQNINWGGVLKLGSGAFEVVCGEGRHVEPDSAPIRGDWEGQQARREKDKSGVLRGQ